MRGKRAWAAGKTPKAAILTFWVHFFGPGFLEVPVRGSRCRKKPEEGEEKEKKKSTNLVVML